MNPARRVELGQDSQETPFAANEICLVGDIHSENFGTFKADGNAVWFDINDFDETTRGSFDFDCKRMAASLFLAAGQYGLDWPDAVAAVSGFARAYAKKWRILRNTTSPAALDSTTRGSLTRRRSSH